MAGAGLANLALGSLFAWSVFADPLRVAFGATATQLSAVFSTALVAFTLVVLACGALADRRAPRGLVLASALLAAAGLLTSAAAPSLAWVLLGYGLLFGVANGVGYVTALAVAGRTGGRRRGTAVGVAVAAYAAGPVLVGPAAAALVQARGWRTGFAALAVVLLAALLVAAGLLPAAGAAETAPATGRPGAGHGLALLWGVFLLGTAPALLAFAHAAALLGERGATGAAGLAVALLAAGNLAGRVAAGALSDRVGRPPALHVSLGGLAAGCVLLAWTGAAAAALVGLALVGIGYGAQASLVPAATADLVGPERFGAGFGLVFTGWGTAGLVGPGLGAMARDAAGSWAPAFQLGLLAVLLAAVLVARLAPRLK